MPMNPYGQLAQGTAPRVWDNISDEDLDKVNIGMRSLPWYQNLMRSWGQDPGHPHLSDDQAQQVLRAAQANGFVVDEGHIEIDNGGNFHQKGHLLRNVGIGLAIGGLALTGLGAAGIGPLAGAFGGAAAGGVGLGETAATSTAGMGAASVGAAAAPLASTQIGTGAMAGIPAAVSPGVGAAGAVGAGAAAHAAPSWLGPVITGGIGAAGQIGGAAIAASANKRAAELQSAYLHEALDYEKARDIYGYTTEGNRYAAMANAEQPYIDTGRAADTRMAEMMGLPAPSPSRQLAPPPTYPVTGTPGMPSPLSTSPNDLRNRIPGYDPTTGVVTPQVGTPGAGASWSPPPAAVGGQTMMMRAPDGTTKAIPVAQVAAYEQRGAVRV